MEKIKTQSSKTTRIPYLIGIAVLLVVMFGFVVLDLGKKSKLQAIWDGEESSMRLAQILGKHVDLSFLSADILIRRVIDQQHFNTLFGNNEQRSNTEKNFKLWLSETPQVSALAFINENGDVEVAANKKNYEDWSDYSKQPLGYNIFKQISQMDGSYIGRYNYIKSGVPAILIGRKYIKTNGKFGGIVVAAIDPQYFVDFYDSIASGNHKFMSIMLFADNAVIASSPYNSAINELLGRTFLSSQAKDADAIYQQYIDTNDYSKIMALKILPDIKMAVNVVLEQEDYLADWKQNQFKDIGFLALFVVFGSILSFFAVSMARQVTRVQESESSAILASQAKSEFLANMSHELRTPLNAIIGFSEMINSGYFGGINDKQKERIHDINLCGSHLLQLINDILEFSKGDAGKLELVEEQVDLGELIDESTRIMKGRIKTKNISLLVCVEPNLPMLWGDKRKIRQVLINLLSNSFKFTPENGTITVSANIDGYKNIWFSVADSGIGIAEADIPKALSVFGQVHRAQSHEGTGLGLPLCKMYAELHDGKLLLTSKQNEGTTVKITFPHQRSLPNTSATYQAEIKPVLAVEQAAKQEIPNYQTIQTPTPTIEAPVQTQEVPTYQVPKYKPNNEQN